MKFKVLFLTIFMFIKIDAMEKGYCELWQLDKNKILELANKANGPMKLALLCEYMSKKEVENKLSSMNFKFRNFYEKSHIGLKICRKKRPKEFLSEEICDDVTPWDLISQKTGGCKYAYEKIVEIDNMAKEREWEKQTLAARKSIEERERLEALKTKEINNRFEKMLNDFKSK